MRRDRSGRLLPVVRQRANAPRAGSAARRTRRRPRHAEPCAATHRSTVLGSHRAVGPPGRRIARSDPPRRRPDEPGSDRPPVARSMTHGPVPVWYRSMGSDRTGARPAGAPVASSSAFDRRGSGLGVGRAADHARRHGTLQSPASPAIRAPGGASRADTGRRPSRHGPRDRSSGGPPGHRIPGTIRGTARRSPTAAGRSPRPGR
jgi:hypothetical protein